MQGSHGSGEMPGGLLNSCGPEQHSARLPFHAVSPRGRALTLTLLHLHPHELG